MSSTDRGRRRFLTGLAAAGGALTLEGCERIGATLLGASVLDVGERLSETVHRWLAAGTMAQEFTEADLSPTFRANGTESPSDAAYQALAKAGFADWALEIRGLVEKPLKLTLAELRAMPARTQITRHDCVEGWSAIGKWTGVPLAHVLGLAQPKPEARYLVLHCADTMEGGDVPYYESIGMADGYHAQTILAYGLNGADLPIANGAPLRLRVERQLGYKHAKYLMAIEAVTSYAGFHGGRGGYWEDQSNYQWYAGI
jgi:DMSO/TMAO reductase YedYZ molybdopterin-dependent catalytic subunit